MVSGPDFADLAQQAVQAHTANQRKEELADLGRLAIERGVGSVIELGTWLGGTTWFLRQLGLEVTTVDLFAVLEVPPPEASLCAQRVQGVRYVTASTLDALELVGEADLVLIDADHRYEGVKADWEAWRPRARKLVAFHDIILPPHYAGKMGVYQLWAEIKAQGFETRELIGPGAFEGSPWGGIGVVLL